jgi:hypothetical protein
MGGKHGAGVVVQGITPMSRKGVVVGVVVQGVAPV